MEKGTKIISKVKENALTYLSEEKLWTIYDIVSGLTKKNVFGIIIEAGCALGGSSIVIAAAKEKNQKMFVFDTFSMIPPPSPKDDSDVHQRYATIESGNSLGINGEQYYGYRNDLQEFFCKNLFDFGTQADEHNIFMVKGLLQNTMLIQETVAFAHIDVDWYESVLHCLQNIVPHLSLNGVIIIDDYTTWSGCRKATDEYFSSISENFQFSGEKNGHLIITRIK